MNHIYQGSHARVPNQARNRQQHLLTQSLDLKPHIEITSSGTTQRRIVNNSASRYDNVTAQMIMKQQQKQ